MCKSRVIDRPFQIKLDGPPGTVGGKHGRCLLIGEGTMKILVNAMCVYITFLSQGPVMLLSQGWGNSPSNRPIYVLFP